jgi:hypothetical protein
MALRFIDSSWSRRIGFICHLNGPTAGAVLNSQRQDDPTDYAGALLSHRERMIGDYLFDTAAPSSFDKVLNLGLQTSF